MRWVSTAFKTAEHLMMFDILQGRVVHSDFVGQWVSRYILVSKQAEDFFISVKEQARNWGF